MNNQIDNHFFCCISRHKMIIVASQNMQTWKSKIILLEFAHINSCISSACDISNSTFVWMNCRTAVITKQLPDILMTCLLLCERIKYYKCVFLKLQFMCRTIQQRFPKSVGLITHRKINSFESDLICNECDFFVLFPSHLFRFSVIKFRCRILDGFSAQS